MKRPSLALLLTLFVLPFDKSWSFPLVSMKKLKAGASLKSNRNDSSNDDNKHACLVKIPCLYTHDELMDIMSSIKRRRLFHAVQFVDASNRVLEGPFSKTLPDPTGLEICTTTTYSYSKATSMLQLQKSDSGDIDAPRYIPVIPGEEDVLVSNGWSFLDADDSEPTSAFDVDKANEEGQYIPKWFHDVTLDDDRPLSSLGYDLNPIASQNLLVLADTVLSSSLQARSVLLDGSTDPPGRKLTNNGYDFSGSVQVDEIPKGIFLCALGSLPLFATPDLKPCTATSGWLSFTQPLSNDHITLVYPMDPLTKEKPYDNRIEVICARTGCHLGHYFGKDGGYCINASALNFIPIQRDSDRNGMWIMKDSVEYIQSVGHFAPVSWKLLRDGATSNSQKLLLSLLQDGDSSFERVALGAGCFWHVEHALRRLPGVVETTVGFAGGTVGLKKPMYSDVSNGDTGHAEVVWVTFDPYVLPPSKLFDCFFAMHDPTMVRAHGKRAQGTGQYRSCIFVDNEEMKQTANQVLKECQRNVGLGLSTEIICMPQDIEWFWPAEDRHQRYEERVKRRDPLPLNIKNWMMEYARRSSSIWGSSETMPFEDDGDDGMARIMI